MLWEVAVRCGLKGWMVGWWIEWRREGLDRLANTVELIDSGRLVR
jgi:hypothetical protein